MDNDILLLGIDIGTTDTKCSFYTPDGRVAGSSFSEYSMIHPREGWVEENPEDWWNAILLNISVCEKEQNVNLSQVKGISVSCTNSFFPVDRNCQPLHNAIMQIDQRAASETKWIQNNIGFEKIFRITGNRIARGTFFMPTLLWYLHNCRELVDSAHKFLTPSGFAVAKLTGEYTINESRMGFSLLSDIRNGLWSKELVSTIGLDFSKLPRPCRASEIVGYVTDEISQITGIPAGVPVVGGAMDTVAAAVGAGAVYDGAIFMALGTCGRVCHSTSSDSFDPRLMNCRNAVPGQYLNVDATNACGVALRWFRDTFGAAAQSMAGTKNIEIYEVLDELAEGALPGASGVVFLPYLSGERCPIWNPDAKGAFIGITLSTQFKDMVRSVMEGVAFSLRQGMDLMHIDKDQPIPLGGGIANSRIWCEIIANVVHHPIIRTDINETETLGDAILAGMALNLISNPAEIGKRLISEGEIIYPRQQWMEKYDYCYSNYLELYQCLEKQFSKL